MAPLDSDQKCDYGGGSLYCKNIAKDTMQYFTIFFPPRLNMTHRSTIRGWSIQLGHNLPDNQISFGKNSKHLKGQL